MTRLGGPEEFKECRDWFRYDDDIYITKSACLYTDTPTANNKNCKKLYAKMPELNSSTTYIYNSRNKIVDKCFSIDNSAGWCAVCRPTAKKGQPGYCPDDLKDEPDDDDYDSGEYDDDVSSTRAWGFCDPMCHNSVQNLEARVLQEVNIPCFIDLT